MKRVLVAGGAGMLGHKLWQRLKERFEVWVTVRAGFETYSSLSLFDKERTISGVDAERLDPVIHAFKRSRPDVVVNCIGIVKQSPAAKDPLPSISVNSLFPHRLANLCRTASARLIHISTDCVFSGRKGMYTESDSSDADDLYGRTKYLGEVSGENCLTLRTSIVGRELTSSNGLLEWFLSHRADRVRGYRKAVFSGLTTIALSDVIGSVIEQHPDLTGLYHVSAAPIDKCSLLQLVRDQCRLPVEIVPDDDVVLDRSLDSRRFQETTGWRPPSWSAMVAGLASDPTPYDRWHQDANMTTR